MKIPSYMRAGIVLLMAVVIGGCGGLQCGDWCAEEGIVDGGGIIDDGAGPASTVLAPTLELQVGDGIIYLNWDSTGDSFEVTRDRSDLASTTSLAYDDSSVVNGTRYCYIVRAFDATGASADSNEACGTPMAGISPSVINKSLSATITWPPVAGAASYNIYSQVAAPSISVPKSVSKAVWSDDYLIANVLAPDNSFDWNGLSNCETYPVAVVPVNADGHESAADATYIDVEPSTEGTLDTTFNGTGYIELPSDGYFADVDVLNDGTIIVLVDGPVAGDDRIEAFDEDGNPLWSVNFGPAGDPNHELNMVNAFVVDDAQRIAVAGFDQGVGRATMCRLIPSGGTYIFDDAGFGDGVRVGCAEISSGYAYLSDIAIDSEGRYVLTGTHEPPPFPLGDWDMAVWRVLGTGVLDSSFCPTCVPAGELIFVSPNDISGTGIAVRFDGTHQLIYAAGHDATLPKQVLLMEIIYDDAIGSMTGHIYVDASVTGIYPDVQILKDTDVLFAGSDGVAPEHVYTWVLDQDLVLNAGFPAAFPDPTAGVETRLRSLELDCRDRALIAGYAEDGASLTQFMVMRTADSFVSPDFGFANAGWYLDNHTDDGLAHAVAEDALGRLIVVGKRDAAVTSHPFIIRLQ